MIALNLYELAGFSFDALTHQAVLPVDLSNVSSGADIVAHQTNAGLAREHMKPETGNQPPPGPSVATQPGS